MTALQTSTSRTTSAVVAIVTYRRLGDLDAAIAAVLVDAASVDHPVAVLVVDNDPEGSARPVVAGYHSAGVRYVCEPLPGIAAARNRALDSVPGDRVLIFIDDDERPRDGWLSALLRTHQDTGAAAVAGAVVSEYDAPPDEWLAAGRFFDRRRLPTGTTIEVAATNNLLLDLEQVRASGLRFDLAFGLTGGSDTLFTRLLTQSGRLMVWCDEAVVVDRVPVSRLTRDWVLKRAFRTGNTSSRVSVTLCTTPRQRVRIRAKETMRGASRIVGGSLQIVLGCVVGSIRHRSRGRRAISRGAGTLAGAYGSIYTEYARPHQVLQAANSSGAG